MRLHEEFKLYENMWESADETAKLNDAINEQELDACLNRINKNAKKPIEMDDHFFYAPISLSKEDLKKALKLGTSCMYSNPSDGRSIPAQLVENAYIVVLPAYEKYGDCCSFSIQLTGEHPDTGESVHDYVDEIPYIYIEDYNDITTFEASKEYFTKTIVPQANKLAHEAIEKAWSSYSYSDYSGITSYDVARATIAAYEVIFNDDPSKHIYYGNKPSCEDFIRNIKNTPYVKAHGGLSIRQISESGLGEELKLTSKLHEAKSSDITIIGCDLEETIDHMQKWGRCPKLPYGWFIDNIDDTDSDSRIVFSHRRLPLTVWFYCKYYMGSSYDQCKYELDHYISIDDTEFDHDMETFTRPSPEDFIERIFGIVTEFDNIVEDSTEKNFVKNLRAAGYKRHK